MIHEPEDHSTTVESSFGAAVFWLLLGVMLIMLMGEPSIAQQISNWIGRQP